jgi:hypothetical protein
MMKAFLRDLWIAWHQAEGIEILAPGHSAVEIQRGIALGVNGAAVQPPSETQPSRGRRASKPSKKASSQPRRDAQAGIAGSGAAGQSPSGAQETNARRATKSAKSSSDQTSYETHASVIGGNSAAAQKHNETPDSFSRRAGKSKSSGQDNLETQTFSAGKRAASKAALKSTVTMRPRA